MTAKPVRSSIRSTFATSETGGRRATLRSDDQGFGAAARSAVSCSRPSLATAPCRSREARRRARGRRRGSGGGGECAVVEDRIPLRVGDVEQGGGDRRTDAVQGEHAGHSLNLAVGGECGSRRGADLGGGVPFGEWQGPRALPSHDGEEVVPSVEARRRGPPPRPPVRRCRSRSCSAQPGRGPSPY